MGGYGPLQAHPFFESISWENLQHQTPPKLTAYLPAMSEDDEDCYGNVSQRPECSVWGCGGGAVYTSLRVCLWGVRAPVSGVGGVSVRNSPAEGRGARCAVCVVL